MRGKGGGRVTAGSRGRGRGDNGEPKGTGERGQDGRAEGDKGGLEGAKEEGERQEATRACRGRIGAWGDRGEYGALGEDVRGRTGRLEGRQAG